MRVIRKLLLSGGMLILLAACTTGRYPVEMQVENDDHTYSGTMTVGVGSKPVRLTADEGMAQCEGVTMIGYAGPGCTQNGSIRLQCSDERVINGDWRFDDDCQSGRGAGRDDQGNAVTFLFGEAAGTEVAQSETIPAPAEEPAPQGEGTPVRADSKHYHYLFLIGGGYAVGFGGTWNHDIVFEDASSGVFIVKIETDAAAPMVLSQTSPLAGSEAFAVLPDETGRSGRVVTVRLQAPTDGGEPGITGAVIPASGIPVVNADGEVVGLTVLRDEGARVYGSDRLRRYLPILDPELADMPANPSTAAELRRRIVSSPDS